MNRMFRVLLFSAFILISSKFYGQSDGLQNVVPPSPRTAEFNKFIDYKVSIANGLPDININFYNISVDGNTIPIGISYHASGIKYGQTSGDVGLGWELSPGYRASRTVYGRVDEISTMPDMNNVIPGQSIIYYINNNFANSLARDQYLARYVKVSPGNDIPLITAPASDYLDGQFDLFTVGLPEQDSKFIITNRSNGTITQLANSALKINYTTGTDGLIDGFNIVGGSGAKYKLGQTVANSENLQVTVNGQMKKYSNAWLLSELETHLGKKITFNYTTGQETVTGKRGASRILIEGGMYRHGLNLGVCAYPTVDGDWQAANGPTNVYNTASLANITGVEESVSITRNTDGTINTILISRNHDNAQIKKVSFFYSQNGSKKFLESLHIAGQTNDLVQQYSFEYNSKDANYTFYDCFGYYQNDNAVGDNEFAPKISFTYNYIQECGTVPNPYINGGVDRSSLPTQPVYTLKKITYPTGGTTTYTYESNKYYDPIAGKDIQGGGLRVRKITSNDMASGMGEILEKQYVYGENQSSSGIFLMNYTNANYYMRERREIVDQNDAIGIVHLKAMRTFFHSSSPPDEELNDAYLQSNIGWYPKVRELSNNSYTDYQFSLLPETNPSRVQPYGISNPSISMTFPSYFISQYSFWDQPVLRSKTIYSHPSGTTYQSILKEEYEYFPITLQPDEFTGFKVVPFAVRTSNTTFTPSYYNPASDVYNPYSFTGLNSLFNYSIYRITKADVLLKKKTVTTIDNVNNSELKEVFEYEYTNYNLLSKEKKYTSEGQNILTEYKYPFSYAALTATDMVSQGIKKLNDLNIVNSAVEKSMFKSSSDGTNKRLVSSSFSSYRSDNPLPDNIAQIEVAVPITNFTTSSVQGGAIQRDSRYISKFFFDSYGQNNRLLQQHQKDQPNSSFVWDYSNNYPIAQVVNAAVTDIAHTSFEADGKGGWTFTGTPAIETTAPTGKKAYTLGSSITKSGLNTSATYIVSYWKKVTSGAVAVNGTTPITGKTINGWTYYEHTVTNPAGGLITVSGTSGVIDELRLYPAKAQMTTYTYEPLIGMTGQCDANNRITYYEYDGFGRLKTIRDQDKNVIKTLDYQYQKPNNQ